MATTDMPIADLTAANLDKNVNVEVTEINPELSLPEISRLTMRSPSPRLPGHHHRPIHSPRAPSPTGSVRSSYTSRRHVSRATHWSGGFHRSHRSEVSKELHVQAESEFFALMELMSSMSRRSVSLKDVWMKIISERESLCVEMDRMYERFDEFTEIIERKEKEHHNHHHDHEERKKEIAKLRLELTASINGSLEYKKKLSERDTELGHCRREISELKDNYTYIKTEHEETKRTLEETQLKLVATEEARCRFEEDAKKHHGDLRSLNQRYLELQSSHEELTSKFESTHKELVQVKHSNSVYKKEKHEWMHEKGELDEENRKCKHRNEELKRKVKELTESYERKVREVHELEESVTKVTETVKKVRKEREELEVRITNLTRELEEEHHRWEEAEDRCSKWKLKWEHSEREIVTIREEIRILEVSQTELHETISKKTEEIRLLIIEKERLEEDHHHACGRADENHRQILVLQETIRRTETTIKEKSELIHTHTERIERLESERNDAQSKCRDLSIELAEHTTLIASLKLEISTLGTECHSLRDRCSEWESKYEEVCEEVTEFHSGGSTFEVEIQSLRAMLREAREQKELAINARNTSDHERDQAVARFEEKCREMERLEERLTAQYREHSVRSGGRTVTRYSSFRGGSEIHEHDGELSP